VIVVGYIDESYSGEKPPRTFGLSCLLAMGNEWPWVELAIHKLIEDKNRELIGSARKPIERLHSVDMNNFAKEFKDWDGPERTEFTKRCLVQVFQPHQFGFLSCTISLQDLREVWPDLGQPSLEFAYLVTTKFLLLKLPENVKQRFPGERKVSLIHERCSYDVAMLNAFNSFVMDSSMPDRDMFTTIAPMGWETCTPLQVADFFAYEAMKESHRFEVEPLRSTRRSLVEFLGLHSVEGRGFHMTKSAIAEIKKGLELISG
jgi:hypothetical protein